MQEPHNEATEGGQTPLEVISAKYSGIEDSILRSHERCLAKDAHVKCKRKDEVRKLETAPGPDGNPSDSVFYKCGCTVPLNELKAFRRHLAESGKKRRVVHMLKLGKKGQPTGELDINPAWPYRSLRKKAALRAKRVDKSQLLSAEEI